MKMTIYLTIFWAILTSSCYNSDGAKEMNLYSLVKSETFERVMRFDSSVVVLKPTPKSFQFYREFKEKYNRDFVHRESFVYFLKDYAKKRNIYFSELYLIDLEISGERAYIYKALVYKSQRHIYCVIFENQSKWNVVEKKEIEEPDYLYLQKVVSNEKVIDKNSYTYARVIITYFGENKAISVQLKGLNEKLKYVIPRPPVRRKL